MNTYTGLDMIDKLVSHRSDEVIACLDQITNISEEESAVYAWVAARWEYYLNDEGNIWFYHCEYFQCKEEGWRNFTHSEDDKSDVRKLIEQIKKVLEVQFNIEEAERLISAAAIFKVGYPELVDVGNGMTDGYNQNVRQLWQEFFPYKERFKNALGQHWLFESEWITCAQVMWEYYRWYGDKYDDWFCADACEYFLKYAAELRPHNPIHYSVFFEKRKFQYPDKKNKLVDKESFIQLNTTYGINQLYYAQYLNFYAKDNKKALIYYKLFVEAEPGLMPDNLFNFQDECAYWRMYQASTQLAYSEMGLIFEQLSDDRKAEECFLNAIRLDATNFLAPYHLLARLYKKQNKKEEAIKMLELKVEFYTKPSSSGITKTYKEWYFSPAAKVSDYYKRMDFYMPSDWLEEIATFYFSQKKYAQAQNYYKKLKQMIADPIFDFDLRLRFSGKNEMRDRQDYVLNLRKEVLAKQAMIAFETKDYWQSRTLCEQLFAIDPNSEIALELLIEIEQLIN